MKHFPKNYIDSNMKRVRSVNSFTSVPARKRIARSKSLPSSEGLDVESFRQRESDFKKDRMNFVIQNSISANSINDVCQNRRYMQSFDWTFSNVIEPELVATDQKDSGRCWIFAVLNVIRHKMICKYGLENDFEFSQSYLSFWDKLEKCNFFLNEIIKNRNTSNFHQDHYVTQLLTGPVSDGGYWVTCKNLIMKYGLVPQAVFDESFNSSNTEEMNYILEYKLREFAYQIYEKRRSSDQTLLKLKDEMIDTVYHIMSKLFGSPKLPDSEFTWSYLRDSDKNLIAMIERQAKQQSEQRYENLELKESVTSTPNRFYREMVPLDLDRMIQIGHDPRHSYYKCYTSSVPDSVYQAEQGIFLNLPIEELIQSCKRSILDNTPVVFMCDVAKHMNIFEGLLDTKCFDYESVFNTKFNTMNKATRLDFRESYASHAMVITGVDLDETGNPKKWQVENSWGQILGDLIMTDSWFREYVYELIVEEEYLGDSIKQVYEKEKIRPTALHFTDPMI